jgi:predicted dinucleotide-binding enzyme
MMQLNRLLQALVLMTFCSLPAQADRIAVIGTGSVGGALGPEFAALGHDIVYGSREPRRDDVQALVERTAGNASATTPAESVVGADIVVLAVPGNLAVQITEGLGDLSGKIIIDPTNHIARDGSVPVLGTLPSNAEAIQAAAPGSKVVKAFNTLNWQQMVDPASSGGPVSIPLVGDDEAAKAKVAALVEGMGLEAIDLGPLSYAGHVEGMLLLWINARMSGQPFDYHLRRKPAPQ